MEPWFAMFHVAHAIALPGLARESPDWLTLVLTFGRGPVLVYPSGRFPIGLQFVVGGGEGGIGPHQLFQHSILCVSSRSEGFKIFVEVSIRPGWNIHLI